MLKKLPVAVLTLLLTATITTASFDMAHAKKGRNKAFAAGIALGILGLGMLESSRREHCERGPVRCRWVRGDCYYNRYDELICESRHRRCEREYYCD